MSSSSPTFKQEKITSTASSKAATDLLVDMRNNNNDDDEDDHVAVAIQPAVVVEPPPPPIILPVTTLPPAGATAATGQRHQRWSSSDHEEHDDAHDDELLHRSVADAGRWAFGTIFVEVWLMNESRTALYRPKAGWWIDPIYHISTCCSEEQQHMRRTDDENADTTAAHDDPMITRLTDEKRNDYCPPTPVTPGVGLPGVLWIQDKKTKQGQQPRRRVVVWRNVKALAADHDQAWDARLQLLAELGLGWAAAVPLFVVDHPYNVNRSSREKQGIVIYMTRQGVDGRRLRSVHNETYLVAATNLIAAALAVRGPRQQAMQERNGEATRAIRRVRARLAVIQRFKQDLRQVTRENEQTKKQQHDDDSNIERPDQVQAVTTTPTTFLARFGLKVRRKVISTLRKCRGANVQPPPSFTWEQAGVTFVGVFFTTLVLTLLSKSLVAVFGSDYSLVLGPFGALLTLLYALAQAPASQPRNCIVGQVISTTIALAFTYIDGLSTYPQLRSSLVLALAVSVMVKLGLTHPPAGAMALLFSEGNLGWSHFAVSLLGSVIAIAMATFINNSTELRQYPTSWGFNELNDYVKSLGGAKNDDGKDEADTTNGK